MDKASVTSTEECQLKISNGLSTANTQAPVNESENAPNSTVNNDTQSSELIEPNDLIDSNKTTEPDLLTSFFPPDCEVNVDTSATCNPQEVDNVCGSNYAMSEQDAQEAYSSCMNDITALCKKNERNDCPNSPKGKKRALCKENDADKSEIVTSQVAAETSEALKTESYKPKKVNIYTADSGPKWYKTHENMYNISRTIIPNKLPEAFNFLPIFGRPKSKADLESFQENKIKEFVGSGLNEEEYSKLAQYCSADRLKTGLELKMPTPYPSFGINSDANPLHMVVQDSSAEDHELCVVKKHKMRQEKDPGNIFSKRLKYRGIRWMPLGQDEDIQTADPETTLQPGKDLLFHIRIYRPFQYNKHKSFRGRHSVFSRDVVLAGQQTLCELRDRFVCANDVDMRLDVSHRVDHPPPANAKDLFPSGFLFISNVFYVDGRAGCADTSACIREWAAGKPDLGRFPKQDMAAVTLDQLRVKLGHPEVYVHQGNCEHLFTFSEIRLVLPSDPLHLSMYPCHTIVSQYQTIYCTTCAEFGAKWIVTGCERVPFNPAFYCDTCLKLYLYKDQKKVCDFKAYSYRGNEINVLKPQG